VICFEGAQYVQDQRFDLHGDAALVLVDWQTSGRVARGERWAFDRYQTRNRIAIDGRLVINDALLLDPADGPLDASFCAGRFDCFASVIVVGQGVAAEAEAIAIQAERHPVEPRAGTLATASRTAGAGTIVRVLGRDPHAVGRLIHELLASVTRRLGEDPWSRKW
jgi:urease accessory protein